MDGDQESSTSSQAKFPLFLVPAKYIIHPTPRLFFSFHDYQFPPLSTLSCRFHDLHEMVGRLLLATQQSPVFHHVFSAKPNQLARVCTSLTDAFSSAADTCPFHVLPLDPFALSFPLPFLPPRPITRHREKRRAVITPVFFWLIRSFRLEIPSARNALVIRNRTYKYPRFLPAIIFYLRGARL